MDRPETPPGERRDPDSPRAETTGERLDRNLTEMIAELRVAIPGVQVLFAFLLVVPFNQRFTATTPFQRTVYFVTLVLTAVSCVLLIAPSVHHRLQFRQQEKEEVVVLGNRVAVIGLCLLALAVTGAMLFVTDFLIGGAVAAATAIGLAVLFALVWYVLPLRRRSAGRIVRRRSR